MAELIYKKLKKDLEQKAIVSADPATTAMVVTKSEFIGYKDQTQQTLNQMTAATTKAQEGVDNLVQGKTPVKGLVVYREENTDKNGIAITENSDSNLAIYKVNADGSASNVKLLLNNKEVALKEDIVATQNTIQTLNTRVDTLDTKYVTLDTWQSIKAIKAFGRIEATEADITDLYATNLYAESDPTQPNQVITKKYMDKRLESTALLDSMNTFTQGNSFMGAVVIMHGRPLRFADKSVKDSLTIQSSDYRDGATVFNQYNTDNSYTTYTLRYNGPQQEWDLVNKGYVDAQVSSQKTNETTNQWFKTDRTYKGKPIYKLVATTDINFTTGVGVENWIFKNLPEVPVSVPMILTCKTIIVYGSWVDMTQGTQIAENVLHTTQFSISAYYNQVLNSVRAVLTSGSLPEKKNMTFTFIMEVA